MSTGIALVCMVLAALFAASAVYIGTNRPFDSSPTSRWSDTDYLAPTQGWREISPAEGKALRETLVNTGGGGDTFGNSFGQYAPQPGGVTTLTIKRTKSGKVAYLVPK